MGISGHLSHKLTGVDVTTTPQQKADAIACVRRMCPEGAAVVLAALALAEEES